MHKAIDGEIRGITPVMFHNGHLADPSNPFSKAMKEITNKGKKKTDDDIVRLHDLEWEGSLYLDADRRIIIPGENIEGCIVDAASKHKKTADFRAGMVCDGAWPLIFDGPKSLDKVKADRRFRDVRGVAVNRNRVMRCRPIFPVWSLKFTVHYLPELVNADDVVKMLVYAGRIIGIGDFTPKYGRFTVEKAEAAS